MLNGKKAAKLRHRELDDKRKKLKEDLEARERVATEANAAAKKLDSRTDEEKLQVCRKQESLFLFNYLSFSFICQQCFPFSLKLRG